MLNRLLTLALLAAASAAPSQIVLLKYCERLKDFVTSPEDTYALMADDAESCTNSECLPVHTAFDALFGQMTTYNYEYDIIATSNTQGVIKFFNYIATGDGCSAMATWVSILTIGSDLKITKVEFVMGDGELEKVNKCVVSVQADEEL